MNYVAHKWSDEENAELMRLHKQGVKPAKMAIVFKTTPGNISWRIRNLKKKAAQEKPKERTIVDLIDDEYCSIDTGETYEDINRIITEECATTAANAKIAKLCDVPDPQWELDPLDEAAIAMKEAAFEEGPEPVACEPTIYDIYDLVKLAVERLHRSAEEQDIIVNSITITVNSGRVDVSASNACGERVGWHKKYQPVSGNSTD